MTKSSKQMKKHLQSKKRRLTKSKKTTRKHLKTKQYVMKGGSDVSIIKYTDLENLFDFQSDGKTENSINLITEYIMTSVSEFKLFDDAIQTYPSQHGYEGEKILKSLIYGTIIYKIYILYNKIAQRQPVSNSTDFGLHKDYINDIGIKLKNMPDLNNNINNNPEKDVSKNQKAYLNKLFEIKEDLNHEFNRYFNELTRLRMNK